jgi:vacuolar-type H+-ATPase subunit H
MTQGQSSDDARSALQRIKEAEEKARAIIEEARVKTAAEILRKGYQEAAALKEAVIAAARNDAENKKSEIIAAARKEALGIKQETEEEKAGIRRKAGETLPAAVEEAALKMKILLEGGSF